MPQGMEYDYKILREYSWDSIEKATQEKLNEGFQLVGFPQVIASDNKRESSLIIQCMILPKLVEQQANPIPDMEEPDSKEIQRTLDERATQQISDAMAEYTKDLMEINDLSIQVENGLVNLYKKKKNLGAISGSALIYELKHGKHAPLDLDESRVMNEMDTAIVVGLQVQELKVKGQ